MTLLLIFIAGLFAVSAVMWTLTTLARGLDSRVEQWPLLWATALWLCVAIPVLGLLVSRLPGAASYEALSVLSLHAPLQSIGVMTGGDMDMTSVARGWSADGILNTLAAIYVGGVLLALAKLGWGRYRIHRLILDADCADIAGEEDVLISGDVQSPFAYTPFGQPKHARILLPRSYRGVVSADQIQDIITHERTHIARRDDEYGLVLRVVR